MRKVNPSYKTEEWIREAKIGVLFKKISSWLKEGKSIKFEEFGIKTTPYSKLIQDESKPKKDIMCNLFILIYSGIWQVW